MASLELYIDHVDASLVNQLLAEYDEIQHPAVHVSESITVAGQKALVAIADIKKGAVIFVFKNSLSSIRTRTSIQVGLNEHIEAGDFGSYTNHSCDPNALIRAQICETKATVALISIRNVKIGEEITFDYASTEIDLTPNLKKQYCLCGSLICRGQVKSCIDLTLEEKNVIIEKKLHASYLLQFVNQECIA